MNCPEISQFKIHSVQKPPLHPKEAERLAALKALDILDTSPEEEYNDVVELAAAICNTPISIITLIDEDRQWFKAKVGIEANQTPREIAFCAHCILKEEILEVKDASVDPRFKNNPLVVGGPKIRFYAGAPLYSMSGLPLGSLCVIDTVPKELKPSDRKALRVLANQVGQILELRLTNKHLAYQSHEVEQTNKNLQHFFSIIAHDLRSPFQGFLGLTKAIEESYDDYQREDIVRSIGILSESANDTYSLLENLLEWSTHEVGSILYKPKNVLLDEITQEAAENLSTTSNKKKLSINIDIPEDLSVYIDSKMISSVIRNLLNNSIKFTPEGGFITLSASVADGFATVSISDSGVGLTPDQIKLLTSDNTLETSMGTQGERGTGLGLHLVHTFLGEHNSALEVESVPGKGSTMRFKLPLDQTVH